MRSGGLLASLVVVCALVALTAPSGSSAGAPPRGDPCANAGRDTCGTTGAGFYRVYRYGLRWFGDFRHVVPGEKQTFCVDLGYWYASPAYRYRPASAAKLRNAHGAVVSAEKQARMAYAIWKYGRSARPRQQAAVMLYVHSLMGDGRPGELDPAALGRPVVVLYRRIATAAARFRGPYRVEARVTGTLRVGREATVRIRVRSAAGDALRYARLTLSTEGADVRSSHVRTNGSGLVVAAFTPTAVGVRLRVTTEALAASKPRILVPTSAVAATNGQRLAAPSSDSASATVVVRAQAVVVAAVSSQVARPGSTLFERVGVRGLGGATGQVDVALFGPFATRSQAGCTRRLFWRGKLAVTGDNEVRSRPVQVKQAGFYTYRALLAGTPTISASMSNCSLATSTALVVPRIVAGRRDVADRVRVGRVGGRTPVRVRIPSLGISAPIVPAGIDVVHGVLGLPSNIERTGWWRDGAAPGTRSGAILIAGHVDSASAGAGAFFKLHRAATGARVRLATADGRTYVYRVETVRTYRKSSLPTSVYSTGGAPRLVLVTCGGRFDPASGHYDDNVVVTAAPIEPTH
jgi:hypothetical protein